MNLYVITTCKLYEFLFELIYVIMIFYYIWFDFIIKYLLKLIKRILKTTFNEHKKVFVLDKNKLINEAEQNNKKFIGLING